MLENFKNIELYSKWLNFFVENSWTFWLSIFSPLRGENSWFFSWNFFRRFAAKILESFSTAASRLLKKCQLKKNTDQEPYLFPTRKTKNYCFKHSKTFKNNENMNTKVQEWHWNKFWKSWKIMIFHDFQILFQCYSWTFVCMFSLFLNVLEHLKQ